MWRPRNLTEVWLGDEDELCECLCKCLHVRWFKRTEVFEEEKVWDQTHHSEVWKWRFGGFLENVSFQLHLMQLLFSPVIFQLLLILQQSISFCWIVLKEFDSFHRTKQKVNTAVQRLGVDFQIKLIKRKYDFFFVCLFCSVFQISLSQSLVDAELLCY